MFRSTRKGLNPLCVSVVSCCTFPMFFTTRKGLNPLCVSVVSCCTFPDVLYYPQRIKPFVRVGCFLLTFPEVPQALITAEAKEKPSTEAEGLYHALHFRLV